MTAIEENTPSISDIEQLRAQLRAIGGPSRELVESPASNPICSIAVDDSMRAVSIVWHGYVTSLQLRFAHEYMIELLRTRHLRKLMGDDTLLRSIHPDDQAWIVNDWMPRAVQAGYRAGASKGAESHFAKVAIESIIQGVPEGLIIRAFDSTAEARDWLRHLPF